MLRDNCHIFYSTVFDSLDSAQTLATYEHLKAQPSAYKSHFLEGRFENIYLDAADFPALQMILDEAKTFAAEVLKTQRPLHIGHWFNEMQPGHRTLPHTHEEGEELLSGVFYLTAPENSGDLLIGVGEAQQRVQPEAGKYVFFPPDVVHEVEENKSGHMRLSLGMNVFFVDT